jgi:hypothetical protein
MINAHHRFISGWLLSKPYHCFQVFSLPRLCTREAKARTTEDFARLAKGSTKVVGHTFQQLMTSSLNAIAYQYCHDKFHLYLARVILSIISFIDPIC